MQLNHYIRHNWDKASTIDEIGNRIKRNYVNKLRNQTTLNKEAECNKQKNIFV